MESLEYIYASNESVRDDLVDFFLVQVIQNCAIMPACTGGAANLDKVVMALTHNDKGIELGSEQKYRSTVAVLPGTSVFYCARERWKGKSVKTLWNTLIPLDMSSLQATMKGDDNFLKFGSDGFLQYFTDRRPLSLPVLGWRVVTTGKASNQWRYMYWAGSVPSVQ
jgi:hypothetical protein